MAWVCVGFNGEEKNLDYMHRFAKIINKLKEL